MLNKVIVVSPHPDDETLSCGGTLLKYKDAGSKVYWINVTNMQEEYGFNKERINKRDEEIKKVIKQYRFDEFFDLRLKPAGLDTYPLSRIIGKIAEIFIKIKPDTVIAPYKNDIHSDHRVVSESVYACTKTFRYPFVKKVLMSETISGTEFSTYYEAFSPNHFVDISAYLEKKIEIIKLYKSEIGKHPFPRSEENIRALATVRGAQANCKYAESFMVLKEIW